MAKQPTNKTIRGVYYVSLVAGTCGLVEASTLASARRAAYYEQGHANVSAVRQATYDDIRHIRAMGGWTPEGVR